ncbi:Pyriculol/pyriculariol biosynthesis cluster transcription factor like protein [Verticillium longisporum]|nr:Pyriculol/pyriculariol biosynthesis cluster transcription factor like protein [Verticillium longisporum]
MQYLHQGQYPLVVEKGQVKFVDNYLWAVIYEDLQAIRQVLNVEEDDLDASDANAVNEGANSGVADYVRVKQADYMLTSVQILRLWKLFLERVNPLTKLIHVPTLEPVVIEAAMSHRSILRNTQPLLFAIYLASVISMTSAEALAILGIKKCEAVEKLTKCLKAALTEVNFLTNCDTTIMQALVLYLISLQGRLDSHAAWIMSGVVIRLAQKMGLFRDSERLGLPPFETEMRRRLWWPLVMLDHKYSLFSGLNGEFVSPGWDTKLPQNINDSDLSPASTEVKPQPGPTEMVFSLVVSQVASFIKDHPLDGLGLALRGQGAEPGTSEYEVSVAGLQKFHNDFECLEARLLCIEKQYCDPSAGPIHLAASRVRLSIMDKVRCIALPMRETPEWGTDVCNVQDNIFRIWLTHHESIMKQIHDCADFAWYYKSHFHIDSLLFLLSQLFKRRPVGPFAEPNLEQEWPMTFDLDFFLGNCG